MKQLPHSGKKDKELLSFDDRMWNSLSDTEIDEELDTENEVQIQKITAGTHPGSSPMNRHSLPCSMKKKKT